MLDALAIFVTMAQVTKLALSVALLYAAIRALNSLARWLDNSESQED